MDGTTGLAVGNGVGSAHVGRSRMMVFRAFLAQNVSVGSAFGGFGVSVLPLQQLYGASLGTTTLALALCVLVMGLFSPLLAVVIARLGLRWTMTIGTLMSGAGYALLAFAPSIWMVLLIYGSLIGVGLAMFGPVPSSVLASSWYRDNPGPALGVANMPLLVAILPMMALLVIRGHGLTTFYLMLAAMHLLLLPVILGVSDAPADGTEQLAGEATPAGGKMLAVKALLCSPAFWAMSLGAGYLYAVGITGVSHIVAFAAERGVPAAQGAGLLSIIGAAAVVGSLAIGFLCARLGAPISLAVVAGSLGGGWLVLLSTTSFPLMAVASLVLGAGGAAVFPAMSMLSGTLFGQETMARAIGLLGLVTLPLTFCMPPLAGVLRDFTGHYTPVIVILIGGCVLTTLIFLGMARAARRSSKAQHIAA